MPLSRNAIARPRRVRQHNRQPSTRRKDCAPSAGAVAMIESLEPRVLLSAAQSFGGAEALFAENDGQWANDEIHFGYHTGGSQIFFTDDSIDFALARSGGSADVLATQFALEFDGANAVTPVGADEARTYFNYHVGDQARWVDRVDTFRSVVYEELYAGIDLHTFSRDGEIKYEFHVDAGSDLGQIELTYDGVTSLSIGHDGSLRIETELGTIVDEGLYIYQEIDGQRVEVAGQFVLLDADTYTFNVTGYYDAMRALVIDPTVVWGSYIGGILEDAAQGVAVDSSGNVYTVGYTQSTGWVSGGADTSFNGDVDGFLIKHNTDGAHVWSTFLGGLNDDRANAIAIDSSDRIYVVGQTLSGGWVSGGADTSFNGTVDGFLVKFTAAGTHIRSTYIGGIAHDNANAVAIDPLTDYVYVGGRTDSLGWVSGGFDTSLSGGRDGYIVKFNPAGVEQWSTFVGGTGDEWVNALAVDSVGRVYAAGRTTSFFWAAGGYDTSFNGGSDGFLIRATDAGALVWSTYIGGNADETARALAIDSLNRIYVAGQTDSVGWASGGYDTVLSGSSDGFVIRMNHLGGAAWSTYVGGNAAETASSIAIDQATGNVYVGGSTTSGGWTAGGFDTTFGSVQDGFVVRLTRSGGFIWSTYVGGSQLESVTGLAVAAGTRLYAVGQTYSYNWLAGGADTSYNLLGDGFILKINDRDTRATLATARNFGALPAGVTRTFKSWLDGATERRDYVTFTTSQLTKLTATLTQMTQNVTLQLLDGSGKVLATSAKSGTQTQRIVRYVGAGTYYLRAVRTTLGRTNYTMKFTGIPDRDRFNRANAQNLGAVAAAQTINGYIGETSTNADRNDWYEFTIAAAGTINASLSGLTMPANLRLYDGTGTLLKTSARTGTRNERITYNALSAGTYYLKVYSTALRRTAYALKVWAN
jgi:hypothetical protein